MDQLRVILLELNNLLHSVYVLYVTVCFIVKSSNFHICYLRSKAMFESFNRVIVEWFTTNIFHSTGCYIMTRSNIAFVTPATHCKGPYFGILTLVVSVWRIRKSRIRWHLTHRVTHACDCKLCHNWSRWWIIACPAQSIDRDRLIPGTKGQ